MTLFLLILYVLISLLFFFVCFDIVVLEIKIMFAFIPSFDCPLLNPLSSFYMQYFTKKTQNGLDCVLPFTEKPVNGNNR